VAREGFEALMAGKDKVIAGSLSVKLQGMAAPFVPDEVKAKLHRHLAEPAKG
jgi:hypothetical protein